MLSFSPPDLNVRRLEPLIGKRRLGQLTLAAVERAYAELAEAGLFNCSIVQTHTVLHNAMKKAVQGPPRAQPH